MKTTALVIALAVFAALTPQESKAFSATCSIGTDQVSFIPVNTAEEGIVIHAGIQSKSRMYCEAKNGFTFSGEISVIGPGAFIDALSQDNFYISCLLMSEKRLEGRLGKGKSFVVPGIDFAFGVGPFGARGGLSANLCFFGSNVFAFGGYGALAYIKFSSLKNEGSYEGNL